MVNSPKPFGTLAVSAMILGFSLNPVLAQQGEMLTTLENQVVTSARAWEQTAMDAARSLFWILAGIEIGLAAIWLALQAATLESWFSELARRVMFVGFFAFVLEQGPSFAKAVVDSLYQLGATQGSASPAAVFDAGIRVASQISQQVQFGIFEDNALAIAAVFAMVVVVIAFALVAAIFVAVMVEMYVGLLAGMILLGLGGSSFTKDFAQRYLVYALSVGMKLMGLVMIARIGSDVMLALSRQPASGSDQFISTLAIAGISVVVFIIAMYVPSILQGVVQGASVSSGMEGIRHGSQAASFATGIGFLAAAGAAAGVTAASAARAAGSSTVAAAIRGAVSGAGGMSSAVGSAAKEKAIGSPGAYAGTLMGLANAKLDQSTRSSSRPVPPPARDDN